MQLGDNVASLIDLMSSVVEKGDYIKMTIFHSTKGKNQPSNPALVGSLKALNDLFVAHG